MNTKYIVEGSRAAKVVAKPKTQAATPKMPDAKVAAANLRLLRNSHGLSVEDAAGYIGVGKNLYLRWENGEHLMNLNNAFAVANFYGREVYEIVCTPLAPEVSS